MITLEGERFGEYVRPQARGMPNAMSTISVVEVADSSLDFDTNDKRLLYARAGIREYWVVDVNGRRLLVNRDPQAGDYVSQRALGPADAVRPLTASGPSVRVADLLM